MNLIAAVDRNWAIGYKNELRTYSGGPEMVPRDDNWQGGYHGQKDS